MRDPTEPSTVTIEDVAARAGVSIATVSRVMNGTGQVAPQTAERVFEAIETLKYVPHAAARGLASRKTNTLGLVFPEISGTFFSALLRGIERSVSENRYALLVYSTQGRDWVGTPDDMPLGRHNTDGLIIFTDSLSEAELRRLYRQRFPMVLLHQTPPADLNIPCVTFENKDGARRLVEHLIGLGHRRIAFLAGPEGTEDSYWREMGYREALAAHDIPVEPDLLGVGGFDDEVAAAAVSGWLERGLAIDAIFAADDKSARGVLKALQDAGKRVPEDIAVAGFDDALLSRYLTPPLTTVRAPIEQAGRIAVEQLIKLIRTKKADPLTLLPTELVIRRSCGFQS